MENIAKFWQFLSGKKTVFGTIIRAGALVAIKMGYQEATVLLPVADWIMGGGLAHKAVKMSVGAFNAKKDY